MTSEWYSTHPDFDRMRLPGWLLRILDEGDRHEIANAELNCSTSYYRALLAERRATLPETTA